MAETIKVLLIINAAVVGLIVYVALGIITYIVVGKVQGYDWKQNFDEDPLSTVTIMACWPAMWWFAIVMSPFWLTYLAFKVIVKALIRRSDNG